MPEKVNVYKGFHRFGKENVRKSEYLQGFSIRWKTCDRKPPACSQSTRVTVSVKPKHLRTHLEIFFVPIYYITKFPICLHYFVNSRKFLIDNGGFSCYN